MKTIFFFFLLATNFVSCQVKGNGKLITQNRTTSKPFNRIEVSNKLQLFVIQDAENKIIVETNENLQKLIKTTITNGKLIITSTQDIEQTNKKNIYVTYVNLKEVIANSKSNILFKNTSSSEAITLKAMDSSQIYVDIFTQELSIITNNAGFINVSGNADKLFAHAQNGSTIYAEKLIVTEANVKSENRASITVNVLKRLEATTFNGGHIDYYGKPKEVIKHINTHRYIKPRNFWVVDSTNNR